MSSIAYVGTHLLSPRSLERSQIRVEGRKKKIDRHGTGGALEEFGSGLGWSRVWCRMVVLGRCGCLQSGCHCPLPALSPWSVLTFVCCFLFFVLYFSLSPVNPIEDCQSLWSNEMGIKTLHFLGLVGILAGSEHRLIA